MRFVLVLAISCASLSGCITTKTADGVTVSRVDTETTVMLLQTSLTMAQSAYAQWAATKAEVNDAEWQQGMIVRKQNIDMLQALLTQVLTKKAAVTK